LGAFYLTKEVHCVILSIGAIYDDKLMAIDDFCKNFQRLPEIIKTSPIIKKYNKKRRNKMDYTELWIAFAVVFIIAPMIGSWAIHQDWR
tara:strand:+ start:1731 stop:1997 length:267 start_codon:yes stop_codon:yes gene_type:complete